MALTIEEAIARVPFLKDNPNLSITPLTGGITNLNFRIDYDGDKSCVIRITGADTDKLGIRRDVEHEANYQAGLLGIAPEVLFFIEPEGYLVTRFVNGVNIPPQEMVEEYNIQRVVEKLRKFHQNTKPLSGEFNVFRRVEWLTSVSEEYHCHFPNDFDWLRQRMKECEKALLVHPYQPAPCHCDLLNLNFLDEDGDVKILDWEYAGQGDIIYDLSNFSSHHKFTEEKEQFELKAYFGDFSPKHFAHFKLLKPMSEIHEAMWGTTQTGISNLDEDFQGYADYWFDRARKDIQDPRWAQWLLDVSN